MSRRKGRAQQVVIEGVGVFPSFLAAERATGVKWERIRAACDSGATVEGLRARTASDRQRGNRPMAVELDGFTFPSMNAAAFYCGISNKGHLRESLTARGAVISGPGDPSASQRIEPAAATKDILANAARALLDAGRIEDAARVLEMAVTA